MATQHSLPALIKSLLNPARFPGSVERIQLIETHISWVLLAGEHAYKIKKPVNFGFLDFSTLQLRAFYCQEEIRLNRRLAPQIYLDVIAIGGTPDQPCFGVEPAFEYAVKMHRFPVTQTFDVLCQQGALQAQQIDTLADVIALFHQGLSPSLPEKEYGLANKIWAPVWENFHHLQGLLADEDLSLLMALQQAAEREFARCHDLLERRRVDGMIRECHGDLHLGNIVWLDECPVPFDGIEFNADLRWIDVISDIAFLCMDLLHRQRSDLAYRFLDTYMQVSGDYSGLSVLRFYLCYRAMVRAKVSALRLAQGQAETLKDCRDYLALAGQVLVPPMPALIITHGLPGCGKTKLSQSVVEKFGIIRLRSDVERKRLFGMRPLERSHQRQNELYSTHAGKRTYGRLLNLAERILASGFPVVVDAAFLKLDERRQFQALAQSLAIPFVIMQVEAEEDVIRQRLRQRQTENSDASDAGEQVYEVLKAAYEPLTADERLFSVECRNAEGLPSVLWGQLADMTGLRLLVKCFEKQGND